MKKIKISFLLVLFGTFTISIFADNIQDLIAKKHYKQALTLLKKNILPDDVDSRLRIAYIYSWTKNYAEAERNFKIVLRLTPDYYDAVFGLANVYYWEGKYPQAIKLLEKYKNSKVAEKIYSEIYKNQLALHQYSQANKTYKIGTSRHYKAFKNFHKIDIFMASVAFSEAEDKKKIYNIEVKDYWQYSNFSFSYKATTFLLSAGYSKFYRYKKYDNLFSFGISKDVKNWLTSSLQYNICDNADFLEKYSLVNDNYFKIKKYNSFLQMSETYKLYPNKSVMIYTPGINITLFKYLTSTFKYYYSVDSNKKEATSFQIMESYDNSKLRLVASYSKGNEVIDSFYNPLLDSETYLGQFKYNFYKKWFVSGNYSYYSDEKDTVRNEYGGGLGLKF